MKKHIFFTMACILIVYISIVLTGCAQINKSGYGQEGYASEDNAEEEAVNTIQLGSKYKITGPMDELKGAVIEILGNKYWPDTLLSAEEFAERTGISENMYDDFLAEYQHTEAGIDMMILVKAREEELKSIENYLNEYREVLLKIYEQQPQNKAKVSASRIETIGNYVCYIQLGADLTSFEQQENDQMVAYCLEANEKALDIIEKRILSKE